MNSHSRAALMLVAAVVVAVIISMTGYSRFLHAEDEIAGFKPVATIGIDGGVAEIVAATPDGNTVLYSDSDSGKIGVVDISDPSSPEIVAHADLPGEPTSVDVSPDGRWAVAAVFVTKPEEGESPPDFANSPGALVVIDIEDVSSPEVVGVREIGYHPDSVKLTNIDDELVAVVAIENEPVIVDGDGKVLDEDEPGDPNDVGMPGLVQVVVVDTETPSNSTVSDVSFSESLMRQAGLLFPSDPQPEFVDIHGGRAAVSLQENNGIALIDIANPASPSILTLFNTGEASSRLADLTEDDAIVMSEMYPDSVMEPYKKPPEDRAGNAVTPGSRMPDAIAFSPDGSRILSADEGEFNFTGGRGWSIWSLNGGALWDDSGSLERDAVERGHYPESRSENKGIEVEGVAAATFGSTDFAFILSERGSFMAVYDITDTENAPRFVQLIATGVSPEGVTAIPARNLVVTADEISGTLSVFEAVSETYQASADQPILYSEGARMPWAAISGLTAAPTPSEAGKDVLYGVPDNALPTQIYAIETGSGLAKISAAANVNIDGAQARYDGEGITTDTSIVAQGGWWLASEGNADPEGNPNLLVQVNSLGEVVREIQLPNSVDPAANPDMRGTAQGGANGETIRSNGFEGVAISQDGRYLLAAIQREFVGEDGAEFPEGVKYARIARYDLAQIYSHYDRMARCDGLRCGGNWEFFFYPLDSNDDSNWAGLSEILTIGTGQYAVIERDKGLGLDSQLKKIYAFDLSNLTPDADGTPDESDTVAKTEVMDLLDAFFPYEKIEGLALTASGDLWIGLDNDGGEVESRLINTGTMDNPLE